MCIGIVAATKAEIAPFTAAMRNIETEEYSMLKFHKGNYAGIDVIALFCGVCRVNAAIAAPSWSIKDSPVTILPVITEGSSAFARLMPCTRLGSAVK